MNSTLISNIDGNTINIIIITHVSMTPGAAKSVKFGTYGPYIGLRN